ncbi:MAG: hypothetical protein HKN48_12380 [Flavobacteriaceae bacterium]|nr:hypothetical protein [Flavobacteriaceae bacterium]
MNPSSTGWIPKFLNGFDIELLIKNFDDEVVFYQRLKNTGFIYGVSVSTLLESPVSDLDLTNEELTKVNLFHSLLFSYYQKYGQVEQEAFLDTVITFYKAIERGKRSFFQKLSFTSSPSDNLEAILSARLQEANTLIKKDTASLLTYALLYVDVLAFQHYLRDPKSLKNYLEALEHLLIECSVLALKSKQEKNKYDHLVIEMVESSSEFMMNAGPTTSVSALFTSEMSLLEKQYVLDICCLAVWDDRQLDDSEYDFLQKLTTELEFEQSYLEDCIKTLKDFSVVNATKIKLFEYTHPVRHFYKQSSNTVRLLILRNQKRLLKELNESGELLVLLSQSTLRELTSEEKTKVKNQLLDIFKTIPSLTIFMLPGGAILLPLFVKLIPKLLPSAFRENRIDTKEKKTKK